MPLTGTLGIFGDDDTWKNRYRQSVVDVLESGGGDIFGVPIPLDLPLAEMAPDQAEAVLTMIANGEEPFPIMTEGAVECLNLIDTLLPPGANAGVIDPTVPLANVLPPFLDLLAEIGIPDPIPFILENMDNVDLWSDLATCDNKGFAEKLAEAEPAVEKDGLEEKVEAASVCGFSIPDIEINLVLPTISFGFDFALGFDLPTFDPFLNFDIQFPALNWVIINVAFGIFDAIKELIARIGELILKLPEGLPAFITFLIEILIAIILAPILAVLAVLGAAILLVACAIALVKIIITAIIVAFVGFMINAGLIAFSVGGLLGLE